MAVAGGCWARVCTGVAAAGACEGAAVMGVAVAGTCWAGARTGWAVARVAAAAGIGSVMRWVGVPPLVMQLMLGRAQLEEERASPWLRLHC